MSTRVLVLPLFALHFLGSAALLLGAPPDTDDSPGSQAINFRWRSNVWLLLNADAIDAQTTTRPPDTHVFERTGRTSMTVGSNVAFTSNVALRIVGTGESSLTKEQENVPLPSPRMETLAMVRSLVSLTYLNPMGLDLFAGVTAESQMLRQMEIESPVAGSSTTYSKPSATALHVGMVKHGPSWAGGFYYIEGSTKKGGYTTVADDGSSVSGTTSLQIPSRYGVVAEFQAGGVSFDLDFAAIQAASGSENTRAGQPVVDDYFLGKFGSTFAVGDAKMRILASHQTLSYADQAFAAPSSIPLTNLKALYLFTNSESPSYIGAILGYGKDKVSIPEYNADIMVKRFGLLIGTQISF